MKAYKVLIPEVMADTISREHSEKLVYLFYKFSKRFSDTQKGRDLGFAFMRHWLTGFERTGHWIGEEK